MCVMARTIASSMPTSCRSRTSTTARCGRSRCFEGLEKPSLALKKRGIRYIELRSLDVNAYHPLGLDEMQGRFLEVFLLFCMFADSPLIDDCERREIDRNLLDVAHRGREPRLKLQHRGVRLPMRAWALEILESMLPVCEMLDAIEGGAWFEDAVDEQITKVRAAELTPSARMLDEMRDKGEGFYQFARRLSHQHQRYFLERDLSAQRMAELDAMAAQSLAEQERLEADATGRFRPLSRGLLRGDVKGLYWRHGGGVDATVAGLFGQRDTKVSACRGRGSQNGLPAASNLLPIAENAV